MTIRAWHVVFPLTVVTWLVSTWGMAVVVFLLASWASYVVFGGLRHGIIIHGVRNPLRRFGEKQAPQLGDGEGRS
ncbi:MAG: hypothetical protein H0T10_05990 [Actinobacteria bacterium]|nr:hypothetical protein [Actinomycetota bacterium]